MREGRAQHQPAILHRVVRIDFQVALAAQAQVHHRVFGEERQHVVEERNAGFDGGLGQTPSRLSVSAMRVSRVARRMVA